jgi:endonuclease/exonuclease/phosphatase (EEP) superfamily protein YafD
LQEVDPEAEKQLIEGLVSTYPYWAIDSNHRLRTGGIGLFSRYPIVSSSTLVGVFNNQRVVVDVDGTLLVVYNMHATLPQGWMPNPFAFDSSVRATEVQDLMQAVNAESERVLVIGDFNMPDQSNDYRALTAVLTDTYREVGWGMGWTHAGPLVVNRDLFNLRWLRIDYIFAIRDGLRPLSAMVWPESGGSDHLPVLSELEISLTG